MLATDILLSIAIVGIYTLLHVYLRTNYNNKKKILILFSEGFKSQQLLPVYYTTL